MKRIDIKAILLGYDTSESAQDLSVLCADCGEHGDGTEIFAGDTWGGYDLPRCEDCGRELAVTLVEDYV